MILQSLLLCSACVGISPFVTKSLSFLRRGLGFDDKGVGVDGDKEPSCGGGLCWNHRRQLPLERKELNGRIWRFCLTNNDDL